MSEYKEPHTISKIIGSPPGYVGYENYSILDEIKNNPHSVILVDEIDKSCNNFKNLFLQILDEGFITNSSFEKIYFNHAIIIMTSNIVSNISTIGFSNNMINNNLKDTFSTEFINRIDYVINFNSLTKNDIKKIIEKEINNVKLKFKNQKIDLEIQKNVIDELIKVSNYNEFGARHIKNIIEEKIDNIVIDNILLGKNKINIKQIV